jgi:hypothetical protein
MMPNQKPGLNWKPDEDRPWKQPPWVSFELWAGDEAKFNRLGNIFHA